MCSLTSRVSASSGNISGSACLNISAQRGHGREDGAALARMAREHRDVGLLGRLHRPEAAQLQPGHATAAALLLDQDVGDAVVLEENAPHSPTQRRQP